MTVSDAYVAGNIAFFGLGQHRAPASIRTRDRPPAELGVELISLH
jgi:hypothetical protein